MKNKMAKFLFFLVIINFSPTLASKISFCEEISDDDIYLDLSSVGINAIREFFVTSSSIKCLNLGNNTISSIDPGAFEGLPELKSLNLSGNSIQFDDFFRLNEFKKLKSLILDEAFLVTSEPVVTERYRQNHYGYGGRDYHEYGRRVSTTMEPSTPSLSGFENSAIFSNLEKLSMCNYRIPEGSLLLNKFVIPNLSHLDLTGNGIFSDNELKNDITKNLTHLYLDDNEVKTFSGLKFPKLRYLSLNNNKIRKLCAIYCNENSMTPRAMQALENLSIEGNEISAVDADSFVNSANLVSLNLARNLIKHLDRRTFDNMTNLENLTLDTNRFERIPNICGLKNLRLLSINENRITSIDETSFCNLKKLTFVSLRKNHLRIVASGTFQNIPGLMKLDISSNDISLLPENWMRSNISLEELNLDANSFNDISSMSLGQFKHLGYLSIGQNPLRTITVRSLIDLPVNTTLDLARFCEVKGASNLGKKSIPTTSMTTQPYDEPYYD